MKYEALIKNIMKTDLIYVSPETNIKDIARILKSQHIGSVLVKDDHEDKVLGIITDTDIINGYVVDKKGEKAKNIMTKNLITISEKKTIEDAARLMIEKHIERVLVKKNGRIVGMVSTMDILQVEPELYKNLLEALKMKSGPIYKDETMFGQCERCGNYSDDLKEVNGMWLCKECREELGVE